MFYWENNKFGIRPFSGHDVKDLQKSLNDKDVIENLGKLPYPYTLKNAQNWINECEKIYRKKNLSSIPLAIVANNKIIGGISLENIEDYKAELGYWLSKKYWNQEIMTSAIKEIIQFAFCELGMKRIYANVFLNNLASQKVLLKSGFIKEGHLRKNYYKNKELIDTYIFAITK